MADLVQELALVRQRRNPARISQRNFEIVQGEDIDFAITVWNRDTDYAPIDVTGSDVWVSLFRGSERDHDRDRGYHDYGWWRSGVDIPVLQVRGDQSAQAGLITVSVTAAHTTALNGRYWMLIHTVRRVPGMVADFSPADFSAEFNVSGIADGANTTVLGSCVLDVVGHWWSPGLLAVPSLGAAGAVGVSPVVVVPVVVTPAGMPLPPSGFAYLESSSGAFYTDSSGAFYIAALA